MLANFISNSTKRRVTKELMMLMKRWKLQEALELVEEEDLWLIRSQSTPVMNAGREWPSKSRSTIPEKWAKQIGANTVVILIILSKDLLPVIIKTKKERLR